MAKVPCPICKRDLTGTETECPYCINETGWGTTPTTNSISTQLDVGAAGGASPLKLPWLVKPATWVHLKARSLKVVSVIAVAGLLLHVVLVMGAMTRPETGFSVSGLNTVSPFFVVAPTIGLAIYTKAWARYWVWLLIGTVLGFMFHISGFGLCGALLGDQAHLVFRATRAKNVA